MNTKKYRAFGLAALVLLLAPLGAFAQKAAQGTFSTVEIQVKDLATDEIISTVRPGGTVTLQEGQKVRLIMSALHTGQGRAYYPETEFTELEPGRGRVRVTRTSVENANATVEIVNLPNSNRSWTETLRYKVVEEIAIPNGQREGSVTIRVEPASASAPIGSASAKSARELTNLLYRGILLRDLDETGAASYISRIENDGYPALVQIAQEMARSEESRVRVYERTGATNQQRLDALYLNLLGLSASQVDSAERDANMRMISGGRMEQLVTNLVSSDRFLDLHGLTRERTALRRFR